MYSLLTAGAGAAGGSAADDKTFVLKFTSQTYGGGGGADASETPSAASDGTDTHTHTHTHTSTGSERTDGRKDEKVFVVIESGARVHTTHYMRGATRTPTPFVAKIRKHIRGWRCTCVCVCGMDRVLDFGFGQYHLIVELYDRGNVLLCEDMRAVPYPLAAADGPAAASPEAGEREYRIMAVLRKYTLPGAAAAPAGGEAEPAPTAGVRVAVKEMYPVPRGAGTNIWTTGKGVDGTGADSAEALVEALPRDAPIPLAMKSDADLARAIADYLVAFEARPMSSKQRKKMTLATALIWKGSGLDVFGAALVEHAIACMGLPADAPLSVAYMGGPPAAAAADKSGGKKCGASKEAAAAPRAFNVAMLEQLAAQLRKLPSMLCDIATRPSPAFAFVQFKASAAGSTSTVAAAMKAFSSSMGVAASALPADGAAADTEAAATPPADSAVLARAPSFTPDDRGRIGTWADVQERLRAAIAISATPVSGAPTPAAEPSAAVAAGGDDEDADLQATTQAPPDLPFDFVDFTPRMFAQYESALADGSLAYVEFPSCDALCDEYFSRLDMMRALRNEAAARSAAEKKLDRLREGHREAVSTLQAKHEECYAKARLIEAHAAEVDAACAIVRSALENGFDWAEFSRLVDAEAAAGNPIAKLIVGLTLGKGRIRLALRDEDAAAEAAAAKRQLGGDDSDDDDEDGDGLGDLVRADEGGMSSHAAQRRKASRAKRAQHASDTEGESGVDSEVDAAGADGAADAEAVAESSEVAAASAGPRAKAASSKAQLKVLAKKKASRAAAERKAKLAAAGKAEPGDEGSGPRRGRSAREAPFTTVIEVDVYQTAAANARSYFEEGKAAKAKSEKTAANAEDAVKRAEKQVAAAAAKQVASASAAKAIHAARKPAWYEKFYWFITSEGLIVVAGKNAQDNEQLVKRYLRPQDAYVHADVHGAATVILRNPSNDPKTGNELPPLSLEQAGAFCICLSSAWSSHISTSAWWVAASQVSKTAPTGEYLTTGSFMIRGRKNMLPPVKLELGFVLLWKVDETCVDRHLHDRYVRGAKGADRPAALLMNSATHDRPAVVAEAASIVSTDSAAPPMRDVGADAAAPSDEGSPTVPRLADDTAPAGDESESRDGDSGASDADEDEASGSADSGSEPDKEAEGAAGGADYGAATSTGLPPMPAGPVPIHIRKRAKRLQETHELDATAALERAWAEAAAKRATPREDGKATATAADAADSAAAAPAATAIKRGQRGKLKKLKSKYADQDEEDRALAAAAIGHAFAGAESPAAPSKSSAVEGGKAKPGAPADKRAGQRKAPRPAAAADDDADDAPVAMMDAEADARVIASLAAVPLPDDVLLHAIPMLCPYSVALTYKYRVKLVPGSLKKGKAARAALDAFASQAQLHGAGALGGGSRVAAGGLVVTPRERELLRTIGEAEATSCILGNVKVTAAPAFAASSGGDKAAKRRDVVPMPELSRTTSDM